MSYFLDVVASANIKDTLSNTEADAAVAKVIGSLPSAGHQPELVGLQEWDGPAPKTRLLFAKVKGGSPCLYDPTRYTLLKSRVRQLAPAGFVGRLPGRRSHLGNSNAALYFFADESGNEDTVLINIHLTAEVQKGVGYRSDIKHRLRVARHKLERAHLGVLVRWHVQRGRRVYVTGDTNYDSMPLRPLKSCWEGHEAQEAAGTLGNRTPDYVYALDEASSVRTGRDGSDHKYVVATYIRRRP